MFKRNLAILVLVASLFTGISFAVAQDSTLPPDAPTQEVVTATPSAPTAEATVEPTVPAPVPAPEPTGLSSNDLFLVVVVVAALVLSLFFSHSTTRALAIQVGASIPAFLYQGGKATITTGLDQLDTRAKLTPDTYDDAEVARLRAVVLAVLKEIDAARGVVG